MTLTVTPAATNSSRHAETGGSRGDFDHPIGMPFGPLLAEFGVASRLVFERQRAVGRFEKWIEFETDVAIVAVGLGMDTSAKTSCASRTSWSVICQAICSSSSPFPNERREWSHRIART